MRDYVIFTDSACDINANDLESWGVKFNELTFKFSDDAKEYSNNEMSVNDFYNKMRAGGVAKTSAINVATMTSAFEAVLKEGKDILCISFF